MRNFLLSLCLLLCSCSHHSDHTDVPSQNSWMSSVAPTEVSGFSINGVQPGLQRDKVLSQYILKESGDSMECYDPEAKSQIFLAFSDKEEVVYIEAVKSAALEFNGEPVAFRNSPVNSLSNLLNSTDGTPQPVNDGKAILQLELDNESIRRFVLWDLQEYETKIRGKGGEVRP